MGQGGLRKAENPCAPFLPLMREVDFAVGKRRRERKTSTYLSLPQSPNGASPLLRGGKRKPKV